MRINSGFVIRDICGEKVISGEGNECINFNKLIRLNESAAFLLESVGKSEFTEETMADLLCSKYDVDRERALADAEALCSTLKENGIIA
uniref:PqqD family protein n=1 Tax=Candidatus Cryptobacteroides bacterium TaxID=3085639 RepID=UPI0040289841